MKVSVAKLAFLGSVYLPLLMPRITTVFNFVIPRLRLRSGRDAKLKAVVILGMVEVAIPSMHSGSSEY